MNTTDITDKVAKESSDSTASTHPMHHEGGKAHALEHQSKVRDEQTRFWKEVY